MTVHYQSCYCDKKEESVALCHGYIKDVVTSTDLSGVDCKRCIKMEVLYRKSYDKSLFDKISDWIVVTYCMIRYKRKAWPVNGIDDNQ